ncbi:Nucleolar complex protein 4-like protein B [Armadillidium nasatum]|uniref:Nucleolar complex protein 4-like protein B n=1 Tax=Armadillidium nasatum TaxID=96803 RepID=A0A5N5SXC4_9CRUS|nr:Nucleolar complex protein 4-like protein B [Armadillidium nasatum]
MDLVSPKVVYKEFKKDKVKNANIIVDLLKQLEELEKSPKVEYENWLLERYKDLHKQLLVIAVDSKVPQPVQEISLIAIIKLLQKEVIYHVNKEKVENLFFPLELLKNMYSKFLLSGMTCRHLLIKLKEYMQCPDFLFASLYVLTDIIPTNAKDSPPFFLQNVIDLLELIELPKEEIKPLNEPLLFSDGKKGDESVDKDENLTNEHKFEFPLLKGKKYFNLIWEAVLKMNFSFDVYKRCLIILPEKVMMHLDNPVRLTDFFMGAYVQGGIVSILAMHGVFVLITEYNLDYPDFYGKVYALLQPSIFQAKYKNRFFKLINKFFMSPYLPEYIVAAFIKKISRLLLTAPSHCLPFVMKFVVNLMLRFPSLKRLINNHNIISIENDPYLPDETNLFKCRAGESSLWEIGTIKQHPLYGIAKETSFLDRNLPDYEHDISKCINDSYSDNGRD